jgi:hypothetical protein
VDRAISNQRRCGLHALPSWTRSFGAAGAGLILLVVFTASPVFANPTLREVTNNNDSGPGSLRQAIFDADNSNTGDTILFVGVSGTITLTLGTLVIEHSLTISGPGASTLAVSGGGTSQVFVIKSGATVSISGLTIENGFTSTLNGGGILISGGTLTLLIVPSLVTPLLITTAAASRTTET